MGCEMDTPYCDECHAKFMSVPTDEFEPCNECKEMLKTYCWVCNTNVGKPVKDGACKECSK